MVEAKELKDDGSTYVDLPEDDGDAMEVILRVLHHAPLEIPASMDLPILAAVAVHCDKYDCTDVLRPWILDWLGAISPIDMTPVNLGLQLLTTVEIQASRQFRETFLLASKELNAEFLTEWNQHEMLQSLPEKIAGS